MKTSALASTILNLILVAAPLAIISCASKPVDRKLVDGLLEECPSSPNCVQTEYSVDLDHYFKPIAIPEKYLTTHEAKVENSPAQDSVSNQSEDLVVQPYKAIDAAKLMAQVVSSIQAIDGTVKTQGSHYLHATFTSNLFKFVDDFEVRIDSTKQLLHLRSASRTGYSDMGVNSERAQRFREHFLEIHSQAQ